MIVTTNTQVSSALRRRTSVFLDIEKAVLIQVMATYTTKASAARALGIPDKSLYNKLIKHGLRKYGHGRS
ncbi:MAG: hypothetical protein KAG61_13245, partial [Bacteriovoracaceae bacterium]|nr:hypothetical protein [Bacteriovoracaceae bacterium]